jgi:hypothetical protein
MWLLHMGVAEAPLCNQMLGLWLCRSLTLLQ